IRLRFLKANYRLARLGVPQSFPRQPFDGLGITAQGVNRSFKLFAADFLLLNLTVQQQDSLSHPFVLLNERQIPDRDTQHARQTQEENYYPGQLAPDAKIDVHPRELTTGGAATEGEFRATARRLNLPQVRVNATGPGVSMN